MRLIVNMLLGRGWQSEIRRADARERTGKGTSVHESRRGACYPSPRSVSGSAACWRLRGCSRERLDAASPRRACGSLRCAFSWLRRRWALPRTRPSRSLPGQTRSGQTLRRPQPASWILAMSVVGDAVHGGRVATEITAARTVLQPLRPAPIIRADRFVGLLPDAGSARRRAGTNGSLGSSSRVSPKSLIRVTRTGTGQWGVFRGGGDLRSRGQPGLHGSEESVVPCFAKEGPPGNPPFRRRLVGRRLVRYRVQEVGGRLRRSPS